jgi:hypothetical protein
MRIAPLTDLVTSRNPRYEPQVLIEILHHVPKLLLLDMGVGKPEIDLRTVRLQRFGLQGIGPRPRSRASGQPTLARVRKKPCAPLRKTRLDTRQKREEREARPHKVLFGARHSGVSWWCQRNCSRSFNFTGLTSSLAQINSWECKGGSSAASHQRPRTPSRCGAPWPHKS